MAAGTDPRRLRVGIVGTGRVGSVLGAALARAGHQVVAVSAVSDTSRARAERLLPGVPIRPVDEVVAAAELVLLTVPDDALRTVVAGLAATGAWHPGHLLVHTSGAYGIDVLDAAAARGAIALAVHPAMSFAGRAEDLDRLDGAVFGITAEPEYQPVAEALVLEIGGEAVWIPETSRPIYHAALTHAANHLVTLQADAMELLSSAGVVAPARLLAPLTGAALDNVLRLGDAALTGPVSRGDARTIAGHVEVLRRRSGDLVDSYVVMARRTAQRAAAAGRIDDDQLAGVLAALSGPPGQPPSSDPDSAGGPPD